MSFNLSFGPFQDKQNLAVLSICYNQYVRERANFLADTDKT